MRTKIGRVLCACAIAITTVTCAPSGMEVMGDAMTDAGQSLADAADEMRDATIDAVHDTGTTLMDTGSVIRDSAGDDASAQCATCTPTGAARTITADTDPTQMVGDTRTGLPFGRGTELAVGPLVVTDLAVFPAYAQGGGFTPYVAALFTVADTEFCDDMHAFVSPSGPPTSMRMLGVVQYGPGGSTGAYATVTDIRGARIIVPAGHRLCVETRSGDSNVSWTAFRTYD